MKTTLSKALRERLTAAPPTPAPIKWVSEPALSVGTERVDRANAYRSSRYAWALAVDPAAVAKFEREAQRRRVS